MAFSGPGQTIAKAFGLDDATRHFTQDDKWGTYINQNPYQRTSCGWPYTSRWFV
jgi:hypothetical protein